MVYDQLISPLLSWSRKTLQFGSSEAQPVPPPTFKFTYISFVCGIGCGFIISYLYRRIFSKSKRKTEESGPEPIYNDLSGNAKMVLVVRSDLKMGKGKAAAQCAHAAVKGYRCAAQFSPELLMDWLQNGEPKIILKTESERDLVQLQKAAQERGLFATIIRDAGRTQIAPNSRTVLGIGPGPSSVIDCVTSHLKLY